jgi:hypothetical protein
MVDVAAKVLNSADDNPDNDPYPFDWVVHEFTTFDQTLQSPTLVNVSGELAQRMISISYAWGIQWDATYEFCNIGIRRLSNLKSITTALPPGVIVFTRNSGSPQGVGSEYTFFFAGAYGDGVLDPGECKNVNYTFGYLSDESQMTEVRMTVYGLILP